MVTKFLYINGDSWLGHYCARVTNNNHPLFKDIFVINKSFPGANNLSIINRTRQDLEYLQKINIKPYVCIGLSEVGRLSTSTDLSRREFFAEFALAKPQADLNDFLKQIHDEEIKLLETILKDYQHYICDAWTFVPSQPNKGIIDFIDQDFSTVKMPVYTVGNSVYQWLDQNKKLLKFTKESFLNVLDHKQKYENLLLSNQYVDSSLHLDKSSSDEIYARFFKNVLNTLKLQ